jgi:hypothetical protein
MLLFGLLVVAALNVLAGAGDFCPMVCHHCEAQGHPNKTDG